MKNNLSFAFGTAMKMTIVVMVIGAALAVGKSPAILGIIFLSAAYMGYVLFAGATVGIISFFTSFFSKKKADQEAAEDRVFQRASYVKPQHAETVEPTNVDNDPVAVAMAAFSHLTPEQTQDMVAKLAAMGGIPGAGGKPAATTTKK